jgi:hypothetical protein
MAAVIKVEFSQDGATLVSADGRETFLWDLATGARKDQGPASRWPLLRLGSELRRGSGVTSCPSPLDTKSIAHFTAPRTSNA